MKLVLKTFAAVVYLAGGLDAGLSTASALPAADAGLVTASTFSTPVQEARLVCRYRGCYRVGPYYRRYGYYRPYGYRPYYYAPHVGIGLGGFGIGIY